MIPNGNGFKNEEFWLNSDKDRLNELRQCVNQVGDKLLAVADDCQALMIACDEAVEANNTSQLEHLLNLLWQKFLAMGEICAMLVENSAEGKRLQDEFRRLRDYVEDKVKKPILA